MLLLSERNYGSYVRADLLGLPQGSYDIKIHAVNDGVESSIYSEAAVTVAAQERYGYAFTGLYTPGAYNSDGSLKDGTIVVYVTNENFNSVQVTVNKNSKGDTLSFTGLQELLDTSGYCKYSEYNNNAALDIRILGKIDTTGFPSTAWGSSEEGLQVKYNNTSNNTQITIEGVGNDAVLHGFGILGRDTNYLEIKNLAVMNFADDGISLDTGNSYSWVHNLDIFYGSAGSDADQVKGDGSLDVKGNSKYQTYSYNHFWDSGKCSLCGMKSETGPNYLTYHHNWFDHSDSRHPRIRTMTVHVFNNYYDHNSKYGVGATTGADVFVEGNYFDNCKYPMLSSMQGNDIYGGSATAGEGTFSQELGGSIKAYNNYITGSQTSYWAYNNAAASWSRGSQSSVPEGIDTTTQFDAYQVENRSDTVPETVSAVSGGDKYSNFDTAADFYSYTAQEPAAAMESVKKYAGRMENGDFSYDISAEDDGTNHSLIQGLKDAILAYTSSLKSVYASTFVYAGTSSSAGSESSEVTFTSSTKTLENSQSILGITATSLSNSSDTVATAELTSEGIVITSVSAGSTTITCSDADSNTASIAVTVAASGAIVANVTKAQIVDLTTLIAVTEGSYNLAPSGGLFTKSSVLQTSSDNRFIATCSIDSSGVSLKSGGSLYFKLDSKLSITYTDTASKGTCLYKASDNGKASGDAIYTGSAASEVELEAGNYMICGSSGSSAKIPSLTFASTVFTSSNQTVGNDESTLGLTATSVSSDAVTVATAEVTSSGIVITSVSKGTATITCSAGESSASIAVTVSGSGAITYRVSKYSASGVSVQTANVSDLNDSYFTYTNCTQETEKGYIKVANGKGKITFTTAAAASLKIKFSSTASTNTSVLKLLSGESVINNSNGVATSSVTGKTQTEFTFSLPAAATYTLSAADSAKPAWLYEITVE